ncbi:hypothetical protein K474DRAFT_1576167, partial [Panus rudis PR-1116 ss-1]
WSPMWVLHRLQEQTDASIGILCIWTHNSKQTEATHDSMADILKLDESDALWSLNQLRGPKQYIRGTRGNQMDVPLVLTTLNDQRSFSVKALLDSGCTGSSIDASFVRKNEIETRKLPRPIPVYNADKSLNKGGPITEYVEVVMRIQGHSEKISLAVTELG